MCVEVNHSSEKFSTDKTILAVDASWVLVLVLIVVGKRGAIRSDMACHTVNNFNSADENARWQVNWLQTQIHKCLCISWRATCVNVAALADMGWLGAILDSLFTVQYQFCLGLSDAQCFRTKFLCAPNTAIALETFVIYAVL